MTKEFEFDVFLSHTSANKPLVELIAKRPKSEFGLNPFLDKWDLIPGKTWPNELEGALDQSATTAVFLGAGDKGPWHDQEMQRALVKAVKTREEYRIIPVLLPGVDDSQVSGFLGLRTWVDFRAGVDDELAFKRFVGGIKGEAIDSGGFALPDEPAPYRGLSRFEKEQADFFFGRTPDIERLIAKLGNERFVAVIGASGSGKSSLVRAGLLRRLDEGALPGSQAWRVVIFQPGSEPLRALANQLVQDLPKIERAEAADRLVAQLGKGEDGLRNTLTSWYADSPAPLLLVIDQFEELFTQCNSETRSSKACREAARTLIAGVADLVQFGGGEIRVLITLRADFLDCCLEFPVLRELLEDRQLLLGELGEEALREAVVMPAQNVGAFFEKGLVNLILRDVTGEHGSLPLLQHALFELWKARRGPWLTLAAYEQSGGVTGALKRFAQRIYDGLKPGEQTIARNIFVRITSLGDGVSDTRRRVLRGDLYPVDVKADSVDRVLDKLSGKDARLIVAGDEGVEVTHESLLQEWDTLRGWLESNRDAQRLRQQITEAAQLWQQYGRSDDDLYKGARLELAEQWEQAHPKTLTELEQAFLDAGKAWRSKEREQLEREQREKEAQRQKELEMAQELAEKERLRAEEADARRQEKEASEQRIRKSAWGLGILMVIAVMFMVVAIWYWKASDENAKQAQAATGLAEASEKTAKAEERKAKEQLLNANFNLARAHEEKAVGILNEPEKDRSTDDYRRAILQALQAQRQQIGGTSALRPRTRDQLGRGALENAFAQRWASPSLNLGGTVSSIAFSPDGKLLAGASKDKTVRLWDPATGEPLRTLQGHGDSVWSVAFSPDGKLLASASGDETVRLWDPATGEPLRTLEGHGRSVRSVAFSPDGKLLASASHDKTVRLWDPATGKPLRTLEGHRGSVSSVAFSPDGKLLASASSDNTVRLWDPATGKPLRTLEGHRGSVRTVAFSADGKLLASASHDKTVRLWDPATGEPLRTLEGHRDRVRSVAFSPDGKLLASASRDENVRLWDPATGEPLRTLEGHGRSVRSVAFSPDGKLLASASHDKTVRLWDPATGEPLRTLEGHGDRVRSVAFSPDGKLLASASDDKTVRLWDPATGKPLRTLEGHGGWVWSVAFSPDGKLLASASDDKTVRLWNLRTIYLVRDGHAPSARAALISETLQRLWGLRVDGLDVVPESWDWLLPRDRYYVDHEIRLGEAYGPEYADRMFDIRPLLDPPPPGEDKLDQLLRWLKDQGM